MREFKVFRIQPSQEGDSQINNKWTILHMFYTQNSLFIHFFCDSDYMYLL